MWQAQWQESFEITEFLLEKHDQFTIIVIVLPMRKNEESGYVGCGSRNTEEAEALESK